MSEVQVAKMLSRLVAQAVVDDHPELSRVRWSETATLDVVLKNGEVYTARVAGAESEGLMEFRSDRELEAENSALRSRVGNAERKSAAIATEAEVLNRCLAGMVESFDLLTGVDSPFAGNTMALGCIRGSFTGSIGEARKALLGSQARHHLYAAWHAQSVKDE